MDEDRQNIGELKFKPLYPVSPVPLTLYLTAQYPK